MKTKNRVLILTDSSRHILVESLFPIVRHLCLNPLIEGVYVADRADAENARFYNQLDMSVDQFYARRIDEKYALSTEESYGGELMPLDAFDALWIRLDHPVSNDFLQYVAALLPNHFILNNPNGLVRTMSKEYLPELRSVMGDFMPGVALCHTVDDVVDFAKDYPDGIVLKQVLSFGGRGVVRYGSYESDLHSAAHVEKYLAENGTCLAMEYMKPAGQQSDNRVVVMNGVVVCVIKRMAKDGGWLCNLTSGGTAVNGEITQREIDVVARLDPLMRKAGIFLYGADMLLNSKGERVLSELNTLNVGAIMESEELNGLPLSKFIADNLAECVAARSLEIPVREADLIAA